MIEALLMNSPAGHGVFMSPAVFYAVGAVVAVCLPQGRARALWMLAVPLLALAHAWSLPLGGGGGITMLGYVLEPARADALSRVFALVFSLAAVLSFLFAWRVRDTVQQVASLLYAGSAMGALFAGDLITLFFFWEGVSLSSVFLIWARRTPGATAAGMRYLLVQILSGLLLLSGAVLHIHDTGSAAFEAMELTSFAAVLIFLAFGIKCAFPLLHNWLQDAYPAATITGAVTLSVFTTKLAVYALARGFPGTGLLVYIGAAMTLFPIFYAVIENDLRRVLAYSLNNQLGFMVVGVGIGTPLALNGTVAHAFCHILYKALLFMSMGAVLLRAGTVRASDLGGLYKSMPWTMVFCLVGAASISAFPLFSGFISKSLILSAASDNGYTFVWLILLFASAGVFHHSGIKIPYFAFFAHDSGIRCAEAPKHMLLAMGITAALCVGLGVYPGMLYALLPHPVDYAPYTADHVISQLQLLLFSALAFAVLVRTGVYPPEMHAINLDSDWFTRRALPRLGAWLQARGRQAHAAAAGSARRRILRLQGELRRAHGPHGWLARTWPLGSMVLWTTVLLVFILAANYARTP